jgi:hypothetical protein
VPFAVPLLLVANVDFAVLVKIMFYYGLLEFTMLLVCFTGFYFVFTRLSGCGLIYICPLRPPCSNSASMITKTLYMLGHSLCNFIQMPGLQDRELVPSFAACHVMIRIPGTVVHCLAAQRLHYTIRKKEPEAQIAKPTGPTTHLPHSHHPPPTFTPPTAHNN